RPVDQGTIYCRSGLWEVPPGAVVQIEDEGPLADGRWLVVAVRRPNLFLPPTEIDVKRGSELQKRKREPKPEVVVKSTPRTKTRVGPGSSKWGKPLGSLTPITGKFGESRPGHYHAGIDISCPTGTRVYAARAGTARALSNPGGYGLYVQIDHG